MLNIFLSNLNITNHYIIQECLTVPLYGKRATVQREGQISGVAQVGVGAVSLQSIDACVHLQLYFKDIFKM